MLKNKSLEDFNCVSDEQLFSELTSEEGAAISGGMEIDTDRPGIDYRRFSVPAADPAICENTCLDDPQCQAWTYVRPGVQGESAFCWLKSDVPTPRFDQCCISGTKERSPGLLSPGVSVP